MDASTKNIHQHLIDGCRKGDRIAQYEIYRLYCKAMFNTAERILGMAEEAEDILQEAFLSAFRNIGSYREDASFGAWLKRIVVNKSITALKKRREVETLKEDGGEEFFYEWDEPTPSVDVALIKNGVAQLPTGFRTVLTLYLFEGYDHGEIAGILGITESTSKSQYNRAKKKLREILTKEVNYG